MKSVRLELELRRGDRHRARLQDRSRPGVGRQPALRMEHRRGDGLHGSHPVDRPAVGRTAFGSFTVLDADRQIRYSTIFTLTVTSSFAEGWFILSDDGGKSLLSYVNLVDASTPGELVRDVYGEVNEGGARFDPRKVRLVAYDGLNVAYEWEVLQGSGSVSLDQATLTKTIDIDTEFVGGQAPRRLRSGRWIPAGRRFDRSVGGRQGLPARFQFLQRLSGRPFRANTARRPSISTAAWRSR